MSTKVTEAWMEGRKLPPGPDVDIDLVEVIDQITAGDPIAGLHSQPTTPQWQIEVFDAAKEYAATVSNITYRDIIVRHAELQILYVVAWHWPRSLILSSLFITLNEKLGVIDRTLLDAGVIPRYWIERTLLGM